MREPSPPDRLRTVAARPALRKTKVVATIGPACDAPEMLRRMLEAGVDVARLNLSHGSHAEHEERIAHVRRISAELGANVALMLDTKGVEIRTGPVESGSVVLVAGATFTLHTSPRLGDGSGVSVSYDRLPREVRLDSPVLVDDGRIELRIRSISDDALQCAVVRGGELGSHKGVNLPDVTWSRRSMGPEDREDLLFAARQRVDYVAASFVHAAADVVAIRELLASHGAEIPIIAKIENRRGVENLDEIVAVADGTMVARGDLGVELSVEEVPIVQKRIIRSTVRSGKPVITATQMLDSMERQVRPTRAEASDVANAIFDGTSAVMLSGETARGLHPVEAVLTMASLARHAEAHLREYGDLQQILPHPTQQTTEAIAQAAIAMARHLGAAAILTLTESGFTSRAISKYRPDCPILAVSRSPEVVRKLALNWGVSALLFPDGGSQDDEARIAFGIDRARELGFAPRGARIVASAGISGESGSTNLLRVVTVP
jgi:pyruvate kinase